MAELPPNTVLMMIQGLQYASNVTKIITDQIHKLLLQVGVKYLDKEYLIQILQVFIMKSIPISEQIAEQLHANKKIIFDLNFFEIYVLLQAFSISKLDIGSLYTNLYFA